MRASNNRIVVDLKKVQFAEFYYKNQWDQTRYTKPKFSVHGQVRDPNERAYNSKGKTLRQLATELKITDVWVPHVMLQLSANHSLVYSGENAVNIWREWSVQIFKSVKREYNKRKKR